MKNLPKESKVKGSNGIIYHVNNKYEQFVVEYCSNCENEIFMRWNVTQDGFRAYCPHCGAVLMLCDECQHRDPKVDYAEVYGDNDCDFNHDGDGCCMMSRGLL